MAAGHFNQHASVSGKKYTYDGKLWIASQTATDENDFFHAAFGKRANTDEPYYDRKAKFRRKRWTSFLVYFETEPKPPGLVDILERCVFANGKRKYDSFEENYENYILDVEMTKRCVAVEDIPVLAALENVKITVLSDATDPVIVAGPNQDILGDYPNIEKPKDEVVLCLHNNGFYKLSLTEEFVVQPSEHSSSTQESATLINSAPRSNDAEYKTIEYFRNDSIRYAKRGSAGSKGTDFQITILVVFLLNCLRKLKGFRLSTENKAAGKFDDVVLEWHGGSILLQAKHKENSWRKITVQDLMATNPKKEDFSLLKYFFSYETIKKSGRFKINNVIICTNVDLDQQSMELVDSHSATSESMLEYDDNCDFYTFNSNTISRLKGCIDEYYQMNCKNKDFAKMDFSEENLSDFLQHLQFYANYPCGNYNIETVVGKLLSLVKCCSTSRDSISFTELHTKVKDWFQQKDGVYLNDTQAKAIISDIWRDKYFQKLKNYKVYFQPNSLNFEGSSRIFHVVAEGGYLLYVMKIYMALHDVITKVLCINPEDDFELQKQALKAFGLPRFTFLIIIQPRLLYDTIIDEILATLKRKLQDNQNKKVIVIADSRETLPQQIDSDSRCIVIKEELTFNDFLEDTQKRLLNKKVIEYQGHEVSLEELILIKYHENSNNEKLSLLQDYNNFLNLEIMEFLILDKKIKIGSEVSPLDEDISSYYINRKFKRVTQKMTDNYGEAKKIECVTEEELYDLREKVVVITDDAGMGKSTVLINLAYRIKKKYPHLWVIRIVLNDYTDILKDFKERDKHSIRVEELLNSRNRTKLMNHLEEKVFFMRKKVVLMLDAVDEISPDYTQLILNLLAQCQIAENFAKVFVTTRPHMNCQLEEQLRVKPFTLQQFTEQDQIEMLTKYWMYNLQLEDVNKKKCEEYAGKLLLVLFSWMGLRIKGESGFGKQPLQIKMLGEVFQEKNQSWDWDGCKEYILGKNTEPILPRKVNITRIYEMFIEKKRKVFLDKTNSNVAAKQALEDQFKKFLIYHQVLALEEILTKENCLLFSCYRDLEPNEEIPILKMGIVYKSENRFHFIHRTFAEYFVAKSILTELELQTQNANTEFQKFFFDKIILKNEFHVVRAFIDNILSSSADSLPSNIFQNYQTLRYEINLEDVIDSFVSLVAEGCVAILQLFFKCFNDQKQIDITFYEWNGNIVLSNVLTVVELLVRQKGVNIGHRAFTPIYQAVLNGHFDIMKFLVEKGANLNDKTCLPLHAAVETNRLDMVKFLVRKGADVKLKDSFERSLLYKAVLTNNTNVVGYLLQNTIKRVGWNTQEAIIPYTLAFLGHLKNLKRTLLDVNVTVDNDEPLIFGAARGGQVEIIEYLVQQGADINSTDEDGNTALHIIARSALLSVAECLVALGITIDVKNYLGKTALHCAIGDFQMVRFLVEKGANVNCKNLTGETVLFPAVSSGEVVVVKFLVEHGSDINTKNENGDTVLHSVSLCRDLEIIKYLVSKGMDVNVKNNFRNSPMHIAALHGNLNAVKYFIELKVDINSVTAQEQTALHLAASRGLCDVAEYLVSAGADINIRDNNGRTPLHTTYHQPYLDIIQTLVNLGAKTDIVDNNGCTPLHLLALHGEWDAVEYMSGKHIEIKKNENVTRHYLCDTTLHEAAGAGRFDMLKVLLELGVNINEKDVVNGETVLHYAVTQNNMDMIIFLLEHGAHIDNTNVAGHTALHCAAVWSHTDVCKHLVNCGSDVNAKDNAGCTILHYLAEYKGIDAIQFLVQNGAKTGVTDKAGRTELHHASCTRDLITYSGSGSSSLKKVQLFHQHGVDIKTKDSSGQTAMHLAAFHGQKEIIQYFLDHGMDLSAKDNMGRTILGLAALGGREELLKFLIVSCGVDPTVRDTDGNTVLHSIRFDHQLATIKFLIEKGLSVTATNVNGRLPLHIAAKDGQINVVKYYVERGLDVNLKDNKGISILHLAIQYDRESVVSFLLSRNAKVNNADNEGRTPLHYAALRGNFRAVQNLVNIGGDINFKDKDNHTPLHLAASLHPKRIFNSGSRMNEEHKIHRRFVRLLILLGADVSCEDCNGDTAAVLAEKNNNFNIVQYLKQKLKKTPENA